MKISAEWNQRIAVILLVVSTFFLLCLVMLDYYQNCSASDCASVHAALFPFHDFDFAVIFPLINLLPIPLTLRLFVPCLFLFAIILASFFVLRKKKGTLGAFLDTCCLAIAAVCLFEAGIYFLDPGWWNVHFSNLNFFPFSGITNEGIAAASLSILILISAVRMLRVLKNLRSGKESLTAASIDERKENSH